MVYINTHSCWQRDCCVRLFTLHGRCYRLTECELDMVVFILTGLAPDTKLSDLRISNKKILKQKMKAEAVRIGDRTSELRNDFSNLKVNRC